MRERDALKASVQAVARERDQWKAKASQPEPTPPPPPVEPSDDDYPTFGQTKRIVKESLGDWWKEETKRAQEQQAVRQEREAWLARAGEEVPESMDPTSPIYKKALDLFKDPAQGLSREVNGTLAPTYANSEYIAFLRAKALAVPPAVTDARTAANFASAGGGSSGGAGASGRTELTDEEFLALPEDKRREYQDRKFTEKFGYKPS